MAGPRGMGPGPGGPGGPGGRGMGGKSFVSLTGSVSAVKAAIDAGTSIPEAQGMMAGSVVIPSPHPDLLKALL